MMTAVTSSGTPVRIMPLPTGKGQRLPLANTPRREPRPPAANDGDMRRCLSDIALTQDKSAFATLYQHFAPRLKSWCLRQGATPEAAEELAQEAMVSVWRRAATFDPSKASVATWIFTIVRNKRIDLLRQENRPEPNWQDFELLQEPVPSADFFFLASESAIQVSRHLNGLPEDQKAMLLKAFYEEKSHSEISAETGLPLGTVKSRIRLALSRLKLRLQE
jgi:RNA polymerase sigma-70 factor, ECF subfamily